MYNQMKGDKMGRKSSLGSLVRRRLSDITNSLPQSKSPSLSEKLSAGDVSAQECIEILVKEKLALLKLIQEKNQLLELSGKEIQNLKNHLQKMQLQNWTLAQTNSQMIAELNLSKDKSKLLQHEVMCKEALLKAKNLLLKVQKEVNVHKPEIQEEPMKIVNKSETNEDTIPCNGSRRGRSSRSRSLGSSTISNHQAEKEAAANKRHCVRRQSSSSRIEHEEQADNLFEIDDAVSLKNTANAIGPSSSAEDSSLGARRLSATGRPLRKAAERIQSYKERPLNVKMRRNE